MAIVCVTYRWNRVDKTFAIILYGLLLMLAGYTLVIQNKNTLKRMGETLFGQWSLAAT
jgi:hypothetical protein